MRILMISAFGLAMIAGPALAQNQETQDQTATASSDVGNALSTQGVDYAVDAAIAEEDDRARSRRYLRQARDMALQTQQASKTGADETPAPGGSLQGGGLQINDEVMVNNTSRNSPEAN